MHEELAIARFASVADKERKGYMDLYVIPTLYEVPKERPTCLFFLSVLGIGVCADWISI